MDFSVFYELAHYKQPQTIASKNLNVSNRVHSENFQKNVLKQELACRWP